jgi:hypothetical protein
LRVLGMFVFRWAFSAWQVSVWEDDALAPQHSLLFIAT